MYLAQEILLESATIPAQRNQHKIIVRLKFFSELAKNFQVGVSFWKELLKIKGKLQLGDKVSAPSGQEQKERYNSNA